MEHHLPDTGDNSAELHEKLGDDMAWEKRQSSRQDQLDALEAAGPLNDDMGDEEEEADAEDHGIAPELQITEADLDEMNRRDQLNKPAFFTFADACSILGHKLPTPDLAERRQTAGVRCKDIR